MTRVRVERQPEKHGRSVNYTAIGLRGGWDARYILREPTARNRIIDFQGRGGGIKKTWRPIVSKPNSTVF